MTSPFDWHAVIFVIVGGVIASIAPALTAILNLKSERRRERLALIKEIMRLEFERDKAVEPPRYVATGVAYAYLANRAVDLIEKGRFTREELVNLSAEHRKLSIAGSNPIPLSNANAPAKTDT